MTFGEKVRKLRKQKKLSQNELAKKAGVSARTIFGYEAGTTYPRSESVLNQLANALGVTGDELLSTATPLEFFAFIRTDRNAQTQAQILTQQVVAALRDASLNDEEKDGLAQAVMDAYWEYRHNSRAQNGEKTE